MHASYVTLGKNLKSGGKNEINEQNSIFFFVQDTYDSSKWLGEDRSTKWLAEYGTTSKLLENQGNRGVEHDVNKEQYLTHSHSAQLNQDMPSYR